jgi:hypothetical protein
MKHTATQALVTIAIALAIVVAVKVIQARAQMLSSTHADAAMHTILNTLARGQNPSDPDAEKVAKVIYDGNGHIDAILGTSGSLVVMNAWPKVGAPLGFLRPATPAGQLPACDSAETVQVLARITRSTLAGVMYPRALGGNDGKNFCTAAIARWAAPFANNQATYTVEWLDRANGRYWVQITGRLAR